MGYPMTFPEGCNDPSFNSNLTNHIWYAYTWFYSRAEIRTFTFGLPLVLIIGLLGNGAFLFVVAKIKRLHTITNFYLASLAFADVAFVTASAGTYLYAYNNSPVRHDVPFNTSAGCTLSFGITFALYFTSMSLVTLVTLERYYVICLPLKHRAISNKNRTKKLIAGAWLVGLVLGAVESVKYGKLQRYCTIWPHLPDFRGWPQKVEFCVAFHENVILLGEFVDTIPFFVALIWNGYMYARIVYSLGHRDLVQMQKGPEKNETLEHLKIEAAKVRNQVARMLIVNGSFFFLCQIWVRFNAIDNIFSNILGTGLYKSAETDGTMLVFGRCMLYVNSSLNPFVYNLTSSYYRDAFKEAFLGKTVDQKAALPLTSKPTELSTDGHTNTKI